MIKVCKQCGKSKKMRRTDEICRRCIHDEENRKAAEAIRAYVSSPEYQAWIAERKARKTHKRRKQSEQP